MQFTSKITAALVALASVTNAHMILRSPVPFNAPDSSPIIADGSNYPCKIAGGSGDVKSGPVNAFSVGQTFNFALTGGATHGGGSCQISMAKGTSVNANTKWMVIYSIEGDCPIETSVNGVGTNNDPNNAESTTSNQFPITIPDHPDLPAGDYTLAWTWNNKVGNREFYMNCAYVQLAAAKKKRYEPSKPVKKDQAALPDMFIANIPQGNGCGVTETTDVLYPNPGAFVHKGNNANATYNFQPPTGNCGGVAASAVSGSSSAGSSAAAAAASTSAVANTVSAVSSAKATAASSGSQTVSPDNFATVASSGAASQATSAATSMTASAAATSMAATSATKASSTAVATGSGTTTLTGAQSGPCTNEGAWACAADGKSFQRCASGQWSVAMQMASGMSCVPGVSANFAQNAAGAAKRDARSHVSRRRHGLALS